ncbi:MAG: Dicer-like protein 2 [Geoglossum umbratile]|nr:MAG: Dicer-like protein 2 [Geoglossum umbratile]
MDMDEQFTSSDDGGYTLACETMDEDIVPPPEPTAALTGKDESEGRGGNAAPPETNGVMRPRSYQLEMFDEAMKRNIVVARLWFLAPTVSLCQQQYTVICSQLPALQTRFLSGADNVDRWNNQAIWDGVLKNVRVVVSTHQVLYDALAHGFVRLKELALLVFDEAHHCVESHPANRIMQDFYHPLLRGGGKECVPHILGISASPIVNSKPRGLQIIEENLNALCKTPRIHREELLRYVHLPLLERLTIPTHKGHHGQALNSLLTVYRNLDISQDPRVHSLRAENTERSRAELTKALAMRKTYCQDQFKGLCNKAMHISQEFGVWATNYYIVNSIDRLRSKSNAEVMSGWDDNERQYLTGALSRVEVEEVRPDALEDICQVSPKLARFIDLLVEESGPDFAGLVFIEQRVAAAVLSHLLSVHPRTKHLFECATFVGTSASVFRKSAGIGDLIEPRGQRHTLDDFRNRKKNLIIATSVLEEGIDISACHLVICFSRLPNLKSFVQRRGRARARDSKFVLMLAETTPGVIDRWQELEEEMKKMYLDDQRKLQEIGRIESITEEGDRRYLVESTGALLTLDSALTHLYHFCALLPRSQYVDLRPAFSITEDPVTHYITAEVTLPSCVDSSVRQRAGVGKWQTERMARKDAAFEIYIGLHKAGLVNDYLLPLTKEGIEGVAMVAVETRPSVMSVPERLNPWIPLAHEWFGVTQLCASVVELTGGDSKLQMELLLPSYPPSVPEFTLYWNRNIHFRASIRPSARVDLASPGECDVMRKMTQVLLQSIFRGHMRPNEMDFPALFAPCGEIGDLDLWVGTQEATDLFANRPLDRQYGLVRDKTSNLKPYIFKEWTIDAPRPEDVYDGDREEGPCGELFVRVARVLKRRDFLHPDSKDIPSNLPESSKSDLLLATDCVIDNLPFDCSRFSFFIPAILHRVEVSLVADELRKSLLAPVDIQDLKLVITAISASSAREDTNYQRLEFFGDSILKLCTSIQLMAVNPNWHEGYLSAKKDRAVANSRLARAACETGLHRFIHTKSFTGRKWSPLYISDLLKEQGVSAKREVSTKILADVVEALIGAAFLDGGFEKALKCLNIFLPEMAWQPRQFSNNALYEAAMLGVSIPVHFEDLEKLIGYEFTKKILLVEAMTHPSFEAQPHPASYQRLEFLGDSVLDFVVVTKVFSHYSELSHIQMHLTRSALVNADFLAFLCMESAVDLDINDVVEDENTRTFHTLGKKSPKQLWKFMRHHSQEVVGAQTVSVQRYTQLRDDIWDALASGVSYPWAKLRRIEANKFFSDVIESIIGAIYIDSHGDFSACEAFTERIGILPYLRRILDSGDNSEICLLHPKVQLGLLAQSDEVEYVVGLETDEDSPGSPPRKKRKHVCKVLIAGEEVAVVGDGLSREEVQTKAADEAVGVLLSRRKAEVGRC